VSLEVAAVERDIARIAHLVLARGPEIPTVGFSAQNGLSCILEESGEFIWLAMDSGREVSRERLDSRDEVLYRALDSMVYSAASRYAMEHRVGASRSGLFYSSAKSNWCARSIAAGTRVPPPIGCGGSRGSPRAKRSADTSRHC
jgi:hypothetical protein